MILVTQARPGFDHEADSHYEEAVGYLGLSPDIRIRVYDVYELHALSQEQVVQFKEALFNPNRFDISQTLPVLEAGTYFAYRQVAGQYNEQEEMVQEFLTKILGFEQARVFHSKILAFDQASPDQVESYKSYFLNPVEMTEIQLGAEPYQIKVSDTSDLEEVIGFNDLTRKQLEDLSREFSMDLDDLQVVQAYFQEENRNPNWTELKVIDTYWSDHCRHTTFNTNLDQISIQPGPYADLFQVALDDYLEKRQALARTEKPVTLMDMGTIQAKYLRQQGILDNVELSAEVNACALDIKVDVDGQDEEWILYFKNETHNHPTEIEPFGGASTCVGGGVRDPLSGRSWVYQAMRISGAHDPRSSLDQTRSDKLSQRTICQRAMAGNSDYTNQIGVTAGFTKEVYHPGFEAKRLEAGALISATPKSHVVRLEPQAGDRVILLGGRTGRDGLGAAVGSSQMQTGKSLENAGAEVQKGAAAVERKICRLFRRPEATRLIKRCNDFGAGGVAVAVGELAAGLAIDLNAVPVKYPGLHGGEIALSESQERMAIVIAPEDVEEFLSYSQEEDVEASLIAEVTDQGRLQMTWQGEVIIDLSRDFLDSNGASKHEQAYLKQPEKVFEADVLAGQELSQEGVQSYMSDLNRASQKAMAENFDSSINRSTILYPYGGQYRATQELGMVSKLPVPQGKTKTCSAMAYGYDPYLAENSPFHGGYYAVIESVTRLVCMGFDYRDSRLTFQEYFEALHSDPEKWGKPVLALLGANAAMDGLDLASIGGKDSMSGTYEDLTVPPTLISFAVAPGTIDSILSRPFKQTGSQVVLLENPLQTDQTLDMDLTKAIYQKVYQLAKDKVILAASSVGVHGLLKEIIEMSFGNKISVNLQPAIIDRLGEPMMGAIVLELPQELDLTELFAGLPYQVVGQTQAGHLQAGDQTVDLDQVQKASQAVLDSVYAGASSQPLAEAVSQDKPFSTTFNQGLAGSLPKALVPVILGTNGEYDLIDSLEVAGFQTTSLVIKTSSHQAFEASIADFIQALKQSHLLALPNGYIFGNEPNQPGKAWRLILSRPDVKQTIHDHLAQKRLITGLGSSFAALIETGLIEHGQVTNQSAIQVKANQNGKFISDICQAKIISNHSAFSSQVLDQTYTAPVATSFGRIDLGEAQGQLQDQGQIISVFTDYFNQESIDGLASPDGLVFGSLSGFDRLSADLMQNIPTIQPAPFLAQAYRYFV